MGIIVIVILIIILVVLLYLFVCSLTKKYDDDKPNASKINNRKKIKYKNDSNMNREISNQNLIDNQQLFKDVLLSLRLNDNNLKLINQDFDEYVCVKTRQNFDKYDLKTYFNGYVEKINQIKEIFESKNNLKKVLYDFLKSDNPYKKKSNYKNLESKFLHIINSETKYIIKIEYINNFGSVIDSKKIFISKSKLDDIENNFNNYKTNAQIRKENEEKVQAIKDSLYYKINGILDMANDFKHQIQFESLNNKLDDLAFKLFCKLYKHINDLKEIDSKIYKNIINDINNFTYQMSELMDLNEQLDCYYNSYEFLTLKDNVYMQMIKHEDFYLYIKEKIKYIEDIYGIKTKQKDLFENRPYDLLKIPKKKITKFDFVLTDYSYKKAKENPVKFIIDNVYSNKSIIENVNHLKKLINEIETLKDAQYILSEYKKEYNGFIKLVPDYVVNNDLDGLFDKLGFSNINDRFIHFEYKFINYSKNGQKINSFTCQMNETNIVKIIKAIQTYISKELKADANILSSDLRKNILYRDQFTCSTCYNSLVQEKNLLLEVNIIDDLKYNLVNENNLQTACWRCQQKLNKGEN